MRKNLKLKKAILANGGVTKVAARLKEEPQTVNNWVLRGRVPVAQCAKVVNELGGLTRADLRPGDWKSIWPELVA